VYRTEACVAYAKQAYIDRIDRVQDRKECTAFQVKCPREKERGKESRDGNKKKNRENGIEKKEGKRSLRERCQGNPLSPLTKKSAYTFYGDS
jgi:hypothetical protein